MGDCLGDLATRPLAQGATGRAGRFTGQGNHLAGLFRGDLDGAPGPGASVHRASTLRSSRVTACELRLRWRQRRTVATFTPRWRAIWTLFSPSATASVIRARKATCWPEVCRLTRGSGPWSFVGGQCNPRRFWSTHVALLEVESLVG
jgi:hypothetical protein